MGIVDSLTSGWSDNFTVGRVFGEPVAKDGVTVIPVAAVAGGGGGGEGPTGGETQGEGSGGGFGGMARPAGVYVVRAESVEWIPALDVTKIVLAGIALAGLMVIKHHRPWWCH